VGSGAPYSRTGKWPGDGLAGVADGKRYGFNMPDGLYERDILSWSKHQADLLRPLARGERVNDVDWQHVVEEIEDVELSELNAVRSDVRLMLVLLLKIQGWPDRHGWNDRASRE